MAQGRFWVREARATNQPPSCVLIGRVRSGTVTPSMMLTVPLNNSVSLNLRIKAVGYWERTDELALWLECSGSDEAELIRFLNISNEELACQDEGKQGSAG